MKNEKRTGERKTSEAIDKPTDTAHGRDTVDRRYRDRAQPIDTGNLHVCNSLFIPQSTAQAAELRMGGDDEIAGNANLLAKPSKSSQCEVTGPAATISDGQIGFATQRRSDGVASLPRPANVPPSGGTR
jgi:hypothetical protein